MLRIKNVSKSFKLSNGKKKRVYENLDLEIEQGDFIVVIGANGSGKSTLLNLIGGQYELDSGTILLGESSIKGLKDYEIFRSIARVYQDPNQGVSKSLTVKENILLAKSKGNLMHLRLLKSSIDDLELHQILGDAPLNLKDHADVKVQYLSGGQRQALTLLMAMMKRPSLLLLDEHTAALDPKNSDLLMKFTDELVKKNKITTIMVTHKLEDAYKYGNKLIMFDKGKVSLYINKDKEACPSVEDLRRNFSL